MLAFEACFDVVVVIIVIIMVVVALSLSRVLRRETYTVKLCYKRVGKQLIVSDLLIASSKTSPKNFPPFDKGSVKKTCSLI